MDFLSALAERVLVLDGSMGAYLQMKGLPTGKAPDLLNLERPDAVAEVHRAYVDAGADVILTNTFGATPARLDAHGFGRRSAEINAAAVRIAREAAGGRAFVAGDVGPSGLLPAPTGDASFDDAVATFKVQIEALAEAGVDLLLFETFFDLQELRAAMIAAREAAHGLPVVALMTFTESGRTDTGVTPEAAAVTLEKLGACAVGANCSTGPADMLAVARRMATAAGVPLCFEPNAGLPRQVDGKLIYPMSPEEFGDHGPAFLAAGARLAGGCCGTTPESIRHLRARLDGLTPVTPARRRAVRLASSSRVVGIGAGEPFRLIGERINPTGRRLLARAFAAGDLSPLLAEARAQGEAGADLLDVNVGAPGADEPSLLRRAALALSTATDLPLSFDSSHPAAIEGALRAYPGRALLNSVPADPARMAALLPLARRYGAAVVALLAGERVPESAEERIALAERLLAEAKRQGLAEEDLLFDPLALAVAAMREGAAATFAVIRELSGRGLATVMGLSNVSHGMPARGAINAACLSMAMDAGLDAAIANPGAIELRQAMDAAALFLPARGEATRLADRLAARAAASAPREATHPVAAGSAVERLHRAVLEGDREGALALMSAALAERGDPMALFLETLTGAMRDLGGRFERREKFIPHLVAGAEAMRAAAAWLKPHLPAGGEGAARPPVVFATVRGDVHDIGKNLCILMLENAGFRVIDLGKSVEAETIADAARRESAGLVCLSALMTTTMAEMPAAIAAVRRAAPGARVMVGGAVVTADYARRIGADGWSRDASTIAADADLLLGITKGRPEPA